MVNICKLKLTVLQQEILRLFFLKAGVSLNALRVAKNLNVSQPAVSKALPLLEKENLIKVTKDKESKRLSIKLNQDNRQVIWLKRADNLKQLYESGLVQFLYEQLPSAAVMLFGSYAFGEDDVGSDIDLAVIGAKEKEMDLGKFEKLLDKTIILNYYKSFHNINKNLLNNILSGIILKGMVEL